MASYTVKRSKHATLAANTADTVILGIRPRSIELRNFSTTAVIFYRVDGVASTVSGDDTYRVGPDETLEVDLPRDVEPPQVGLISSGAAAFSVTAIG
jgi:hypothetical protein